MKTAIIAAAGFLALSLPAFAQAPANPAANATTLGTATTSGNSAGVPAANTPAGQMTTTGGGASATPPAIPSMGGAAPNQAVNPTADSSTTGTTTTK